MEITISIGTSGSALIAGFLSGAITSVVIHVFRNRKPVPPMHPATGRYCPICGADAVKNQPCDAGLHG